MWSWIKARALRLVIGLVKEQGAALAVTLLAQVDPTTLADTIRPHIRKLFETTGPDWQAAFAVAWGKINAFVVELLEDPDTGV